MTRCLIVILLIMTLQNGSAQTLDNYVDKLFFGIPSRNPDTTIAEFVQKYVPIIYKKFSPGGKWIALPPPKEEPKFMTVTNSYSFDKHSNFDAPFKSGQLAITQRIYEQKNYIDQISNYKLWFEFDNEQDGKNSYKKLVDTFCSFNVLKRLTSKDGIDKAEFTDKNSNKFYGNVQIIFAKDFFITTGYIIPTKKGFKTISKTGYKIVVEIGNNLY